ncbi:MAG: hypothetical protein CBE00_01325 [Planctomycetaceae bacterium TMED240]|nr:MAG: hypothetical protein CBE00_01325 [Planctomycetaceae bacterium TMED240]
MEKFAGYGVFAVFLEECCSSASARGVFRPTGIKSSGVEWLASASHIRPRWSAPTPRRPPHAGEQAKLWETKRNRQGFRLVSYRIDPRDCGRL